MNETFKRIQSVCFSVMGVALFYIALSFWFSQFSSFFEGLYFQYPYQYINVALFFFVFFLCRTMGCLIFMPKPKLKAILYNDQPVAELSTIVVKAFSAPFIKKILIAGGRFCLEFVLRILSIALFLRCLGYMLPILQAMEISSWLFLGIIALVGFLIMEYPFYWVFYKLAIAGYANRMTEYKFGFKVFIYVLGFSVLGQLFIPLNVMVVSQWATILVNLGFACCALGLWWVMYKKKTCCLCQTGTCQTPCPLCHKIKQFFAKLCPCCKKDKSCCEGKTCSQEKINAESDDKKDGAA